MTTPHIRIESYVALQENTILGTIDALKVIRYVRDDADLRLPLDENKFGAGELVLISLKWGMPCGLWP